MIISFIGGGLGNQLFMYAVGRCLSHRLGTQLKLDVPNHGKKTGSHSDYALDKFNIIENLATNDELQRVKDHNSVIEPVQQPARYLMDVSFMPEVLNAPDDTYLHGYFQSEKYFMEIADIIRREFTLKTFDGERSKYWLDRIRNAECPVSLHIRRGDYITPGLLYLFGVMPFRYYYNCVDELKKSNPKMKVFVFSDDINWVKDNLMLNVPTEFVEGCERDCDELFLMGQCRHNINANSTFSWWGAWLNQNPDKRVLVPDKWFRKHCVNRDVLPESWTKMPVDYSRYPNNDFNHDVSIIVYVHNNISSIADSLSSILSQNINNYECIIIDDASNDQSGAVCRRETELRNNVHLVQMKRPIGQAAAYNLGIDMARNKYVMFLDCSNRILANTAQVMHSLTDRQDINILHSVKYFQENADGDMVIAGKKFSLRTDEAFANLNINGGGV